MRWRELPIDQNRAMSDWRAVLFLSVPFLAGGAAGAVLCAASAPAEAQAMAEYLGGLLSAASDGALALPSFWAVLWEILRYPLLALLLGVAAAGLVGLPALFGVRGFFLGYAITTFASCLGADGLLFAFLLIGVPELVSLPVLFVLGAQSAASALRLLSCFLQGKRPARVLDRKELICTGCCIVALIVWAAAVSSFLPSLVSVAGRLYG